MKLALIQTKATDTDQYENTAKHIIELIEKACLDNPDLILLPECVYPSYLLGEDEDTMEQALAKSTAVIQAVKNEAQRNRVFIVLGIAMFEDEIIRNGAIVFDRNGEVINFDVKSNLWHFDQKWFVAGTSSSVFETEFGTIGVMICADGRIPEIAVMLKKKGAQLILDPVNLAATASKPSELSNQQFAFMLQARARENGVFIAACDKCGVESGLATYLGRSFVCDPEGNMLVQGSPDKEETLFCEIDLSLSKQIAERKPELYSVITKSIEETPIYSLMSKTYQLEDLALYSMVARFHCSSAEDYVRKSIKYIKGAAIFDAKLLVLPALHESYSLSEENIQRIQSHLQDGQLLIFSAAIELNQGSVEKRAFVMWGSAERTVLPFSHQSSEKEIPEIIAVPLTEAISVAMIYGDEVNVPEISRCSMLLGADIIVHFDNGLDEFSLKTQKTRAAENKVFVIRSSSAKEEDRSIIIGPEGNEITTTFISREHVAAGYVNTALSKFKEVVPGTNIITGRIPHFYKELTES